VKIVSLRVFSQSYNKQLNTLPVLLSCSAF
jgi:hypothetical protein